MTLTEWNALNDKGQWDIKVALRGPDCPGDSETIKWYSTAVLRGQLTNVFRVGGTINTHLKMIILPTDGDGQEWGAHHWVDHVHTAAYWMRLPTVLVPGPAYWKAVSRGRKGAGKMFLDSIDEAPAEIRAMLEEHLHYMGGSL